MDEDYATALKNLYTQSAPYLNTAGYGLGVAGGIAQGGTKGDVSAGANAAKLASQYGGYAGIDPSTLKGVNLGATGALDALGVYQGLEQGGVKGYGEALGAGLQGAGTLGGASGLLDSGLASGLSTAGGYVLAPLALYNAIENYQSGATGSDALNGAEAGAAIGSVIPGIGTLIGGLVGGAAGAVSSAFGPGREDPENESWNQIVPQYNALPSDQQQGWLSSLDPSQSFQLLAGVMDAKKDAPGSAEQLEQKYGQMGENNLLNAMGNEINTAYGSGQITPGESSSDIYNNVINPWLNSQGVTVGSDAALGQTGTPGMIVGTNQQEGGALQGVLTNLIGDYTSGQLTPTTQIGIKGQTDAGLPVFAGVNSFGQPATSSPTPVTQTTPATPSGPDFTNPGGPTGNLMQLAQMAYYGNPNGGTGYQYYPGSTPTVTNTPTTQPSSAQPRMWSAEGGSMRKKSALDHVKGKKKKRRRFDDGGDLSDDDYDLPELDVIGGDSDLSGALSSLDSISGSGANTLSTDPSGYTINLPGSYDVGTDNQILPEDSPDYSSSSSSSSSGMSKSLQNLKNNINGTNGVEGILNVLKGVAPLLALAAGATSGSKTNTTPPAPVAGMTQGATPPPTPSYSRSQVMSPSNTASGAPMSLADWYTYGSRPEANFFTNNQVPLAQMTGVTQGQAKGGALSHLDDGEESYGMPEFDSAVQHHVMGPGDGTSDDIPAKLSDGEYVLDANTVSLLGNGSNKAGAARLDALRANIRKHAARPMSKGKQFMKAKPPASYMKGGKQK